MLDTRELGRRPGSQRQVSFSAEAPAELGIEILSVPEGSPVDIDLRLEAVMEGVLVTGTAEADLEGECSRCLEPIEDTVHVDLQELFVYDDPGHERRGDDQDDDVSRLEDDLIDLEPLLRDAVVLALPFQPLCRDDCPGLCAECGARLADDPDHRHDAPIDPRWAALGDVVAARRSTRSTRRLIDQHHRTPRSNRGCPEAEDVAEQHASPSFCVEGRRALARDLRQPRLRRQAPAAPRLPRVRAVRRQGRPSSGPLTRGLGCQQQGRRRPTSCATRSEIPRWIPSCCSLP